MRYRFPNVLGGFRGLNIDFSIWSNIKKAKQWKQLGVPKNIKFGALFDKLDDRNLMRINTLFSHGFKVAAFNDYDSAIKWLNH